MNKHCSTGWPVIGLHLYHLCGEFLPSCGGAMQRMRRLYLTKSETRFNTDKTVTYFFCKTCLNNCYYVIVTKITFLSTQETVLFTT
jgi:hypothetical protein